MSSALIRFPRRLPLTLIALASASVSLLALLLHAAGWLPLYFTVDLMAAPSLVLLLVLGVAAYYTSEREFLNRMITGAWAGVAATLAYDLIRFLIRSSGLIHFNPFLSHPVFGRLITGYPESTPMAIITGWAYHFWNGFGLGLMYTLIAGNAPWHYAVAWAIVLELAWLTTLPSVLHLQLNIPFILVGFVGHACYGIVLGSIAQKFVRGGPEYL